MSDPVTKARAQCRVQNFLSWRWGEVKGKKDPTRSRVYIFWSRVADMIFPADYQTSLSWHWRSVSHVSSSFRQPCPQAVTLDIVSFISMYSSSILFFTVRLFPPSLYRFSCFLLKCTSRVTKGQRQALATNGASRDYIYFYAQTRAHTHCSVSLTDAYITSCHGYSTTHRHRSSEPSTETIPRHHCKGNYTAVKMLTPGYYLHTWPPGDWQHQPLTGKQLFVHLLFLCYKTNFQLLYQPWQQQQKMLNK